MGRVLNLTRVSTLLLIAMLPSCFASTDRPDSAVARANKVSSLTGPGAQPFHLKFAISEPANANSPYSATVEEYWKAANEWTRSVDSPGFRQHVIVKNGKSTEEDDGSYFPLWLRNFIMAAVDPLQDASFWEKVSARIVIEGSAKGRHTSSCARAQFKVGTAEINNDAFAVICFNSDGSLSSVVRPGYDMEFHDPQPFGKKQIAYRYVDDPEPGTELVGQISILEKVDRSSPIPSLPHLNQETPNPIESVPISQDMFERLLQSPLNITWPAVHSGNTRGKLSMYVSADRNGQIREAYPLNSDNAGLQGAARDQLLKAQLKSAVVGGQPVQTEAALTFEFSTSLENNSVALNSTPESAPEASDPTKPITVSPMIANSLRLKMFAPVYPQDLKMKRVGGKVELTAIIGKQGQVISVSPLNSPNEELTRAAIASVQKWVYKPYLLNGVPVEIRTVITVVFEAP
jgi:TonB family protein